MEMVPGGYLLKHVLGPEVYVKIVLLINIIFILNMNEELINRFNIYIIHMILYTDTYIIHIILIL